MDTARVRKGNSDRPEAGDQRRPPQPIGLPLEDGSAGQPGALPVRFRYSPPNSFSSAAPLRQFPTGVFLFCSAFSSVQEFSTIDSALPPTPTSREIEMADTKPEKITFGIGDGKTRTMVQLADGSYADRTAPAAGAGLVTDTTGQVMFDISSLPCKMQYDSSGNQTIITYGPDMKGRFVRQTSTWVDGKLTEQSGWFMVTGMDAP